MKCRTAVLGAISLFALSCMADLAKLEALVVDEVTGMPIRNVGIAGVFDNWRTGFSLHTPDPNVDEAVTDVNGRCRMWGRTNNGQAGCHITSVPSGYYWIRRGWGYDFHRKNLLGVWQPDNVVITIRLQRVEHPIPLFKKRVVFNVGKDIVSVNGGRFSYDLMAGDWLPPFGNGKIADVDFQRLPHEDFGEDGNGSGYKGRMFRDSVTVRFAGKDNGLVELHPLSKVALRIRTAPENGYRPGYLCYQGRGKKLKYETNYDKDRCFCFRIRTRRDGNGKIVEAYYGKIYGDISLYDGYNYTVQGVVFHYYLNPTSLDRNLEWDRKTNLFRPKKKIWNPDDEEP